MSCAPYVATCPPLPETLAFDVPAVCGDLPPIAVCAGIAVVRRPWRWQAGGRRVPAHKLNAVSGVGRRVAGGLATNNGHYRIPMEWQIMEHDTCIMNHTKTGGKQ